MECHLLDMKSATDGLAKTAKKINEIMGRPSEHPSDQDYKIMRLLMDAIRNNAAAERDLATAMGIRNSWDDLGLKKENG